MRNDLPSDPPPEQPRFEPEILPPDDETVSRPRSRVFLYVDENGRQRFAALRPPGPLTVLLALVILGAIAASVLVLVLGFVLIWIPAAILVIAALAFSSHIRAAWRRLIGRTT
jgi:protein-S-isoprenylcysteine O-methyltransferase Ste14